MQVSGHEIEGYRQGGDRLYVTFASLTIAEAAALPADVEVVDGGSVRAMFPGYEVVAARRDPAGRCEVTYARSLPDATRAAVERIEGKVQEVLDAQGGGTEGLAAVARVFAANAVDITDEQALSMPDVFPAWGTGATYRSGQVVAHVGKRWRVLSDHVSQASWEPGAAPSLFAEVLPGQDGGVGEWAQPDSTNPYSKGDRVTHGGKTWESLVDGNVWEPGAAGTAALWKEI